MRVTGDAERRNRPGRAAGWSTALASMVLLLATFAPADEEPPPKGVVDVGWHLTPIGSTLDGQARSPAHGGHDGALRRAWEGVLKRRIGNMRQRLKRLQSPRNWAVDSESKAVLGLRPDKWTPFVRDLATLHTEFGTSATEYGRTWVTSGPAMQRWRRGHPGPDPIGIVPGQLALDEVENAIRELEIAGVAVPFSLIAARDRLQRIVWEEEEREREKKRKEYEERERRARAAVDEQVAATQRRLDLVRKGLEEGQRLLRVLVATLQRIEEDRLRQTLDELPADEKRDATAATLFAKMKKNRAKALAFSGARLSRYGALLSQGWMVHRTKLKTLIARAER